MRDQNRVILVYPDYRGGIDSKASLPVGLGYIARALEVNGIEYEIIDLNIDSRDDLISRITEFHPEILGISLMSYRCNDNYKMLDYLKNMFPSLKIVAGGPHITANRDLVLSECRAIDTGVVGEGEHAFVEIIQGNPLSTVKGALYREEGVIKFAGTRDFIDDLDKVPFPNYHGFKLEKYGETMPLNSSRGCPYKCIFCGAPRILGRKWRNRSVQGLMEELKYWYEIGYRRFYLSDSNFAVDKTRVWNFCEEIIKSRLDASFISDGLRADHVDRRLLEQMRKAGFTDLTFGVESGSSKVLRNLKKGETREQIESALVAATELGFRVRLFFIIGSPGENKEDIKESFALARKYGIYDANFFNLTPIPGTEFHEWAIDNGYLDESNGRYPEGNFGFSKKALICTDVMTKEQLTTCLIQARHVERQLQWRPVLAVSLGRITGREVPINSGFINTLSWIISYPVLTSLFRFVAKSLGALGQLKRKKK